MKIQTKYIVQKGKLEDWRLAVPGIFWISPRGNSINIFISFHPLQNSNRRPHNLYLISLCHEFVHGGCQKMMPGGGNRISIFDTLPFHEP